MSGNFDISGTAGTGDAACIQTKLSQLVQIHVPNWT